MLLNFKWPQKEKKEEVKEVLKYWDRWEELKDKIRGCMCRRKAKAAKLKKN